MENIDLKALRKEKPWIRSRDIIKKPGYYKRYKEKECATCGKLHHNQGKCCSVNCRNRFRIVSDLTKIRISRTLKKHVRTPEGLAHKKLIGINRKSQDYLIDIPDLDLIDLIIP
jgi:hypothetical protein